MTFCLLTIFVGWGGISHLAFGQSSQNPSPMTESIRPHHRVSAAECAGTRMIWEFEDKKLQLFIPDGLSENKPPELIIHFHGAASVSEFSVCHSKDKILLSVNGGSGGSSYESVFAEEENFEELIQNIKQKSNFQNFSRITLSAWSAGYGAIRAIIKQDLHNIDRVILLDGLHTSYVPERTVLYHGGKLDTLNLEPFLQLAQFAIKGEKDFLITHTSIFPGTFASTTECTEYLLERLGLSRKPVLKNGPIGMQQVGEVMSGKFRILSFAGNTAPDHEDHLHGLRWFYESF